jgi:hypothetical protein
MKAKTKFEISVIGQKIQTKIEDIDISKLNYWKENPRINSIIKQSFGNKNISNSEIEQLLWEKVDSVHDLFQDIKNHGGLIDEILVRNNIVLEGNCRLCAYRYLYKRAEEQNDEDEMLKWSYIKARIIPADTDDEVIFAILGIWHIKGKTQWDTYEKAAYLKRLNTDYDYSFKAIADSISQSEKFVKDHIEAYDLMVKHNVYTLEKFSYFYELVKNKHLKEIFNIEPKIKTEVIEAIIGERFRRGEEIRDLPKVLKDKKAKKEFLQEKVEFNEALETTKDRHPEHEDTFYNQVKKLTTSITSCSVEKLEEIKKDGKKKYLFEKLLKELKSFCKKINAKEY